MKLLIPYAYLNEACFLSLNIDDKKFKMCLKLAQENLYDTLGAQFYEAIETQYDPIADTFTTENATLYEDYIKDFLAWQTYYFYLKFAVSDSTPTGPRTFKDDNSDLVNDIQMIALEKNVLAQVNNYRYRMINFLNLEQAKAPTTAYILWNYLCKIEFSFAISSISRDSHKDDIISVTKAVRANE